MTKKIDFDKYALFVDGVTSDSSKDYKSFLDSCLLYTSDAADERSV